MAPSYQRRITRSATEASPYRSIVNATGGKSLMASLTTMKFAAQMTITPRTAASAARRSVDSLTPAGRAGVEVAGVESGSISRRLRSDGVAVELEQLLVVLFGQLQPDEQPSEHRERDDDQRRKRDAEGDGHGLESLHYSYLRQALVVVLLAPGIVTGCRSDGPRATICAMSSRVNSASWWPLPA